MEIKPCRSRRAIARPINALVGLAYHRLAGREPLSLPDDIEVSDRRALVGADHVRRHVRRIVDTAG